MSSSPAVSGTRPDAETLAMRLPGAPLPPATFTTPQALGSRIESPAPSRVSYDPVKLRENLQAAIDHLNQQLSANGRSLGFSMDDAIRYPVVTVRRTDTGEVIRQIPSEAVVRVAHTLDALKGLLHDGST